MVDIEGKEILPGDICIAKMYNGAGKVKIFKETDRSVQLFYWNTTTNDFATNKCWVQKGSTNAVFYKI